MTATDRWAWATHWADLLGQDQVWRDATGTIHQIADMDPGYCGRVRAFILRQADEVFGIIGMRALVGTEHLSEQASIDFDRAFDSFLDAGDNPRAWLEETPLLSALRHRAGISDPTPAPNDQDPFGPYEYVEPSERCHGAEGRCTWGKCEQRSNACRCRCAQCRRQTNPGPHVELRERCSGYLAHEDERNWRKCTGHRDSCQCRCPACCGDTPDVWGAPVY